MSRIFFVQLRTVCIFPSYILGCPFNICWSQAAINSTIASSALRLLRTLTVLHLTLLPVAPWLRSSPPLLGTREQLIALRPSLRLLTDNCCMTASGMEKSSGARATERGQTLCPVKDVYAAFYCIWSKPGYCRATLKATQKGTKLDPQLEFSSFSYCESVESVVEVCWLFPACKWNSSGLDQIYYCHYWYFPA